jgi:uncharacterized protein YchJ
MKKNIADKWVKALTSNEYKQGKNVLCHQGANKQYKYCCLGVLCDLYNKDPNIAKSPKKQLEVTKVKWQVLANRKPADVTCYNHHMEDLPEEVRNWAGLRTSSAEIKNREATSLGFASLAEMNDTGSSFEEISKVIKKNYKKL